MDKDKTTQYLNRVPGYDCLICGERANHDVTLYDSYNTRLCIDHLNQLHEYTFTRGYTRILHELEWKRQALIYSHRGDEFSAAFEAICAQVTAYKESLYFYMKDWVALETERFWNGLIKDEEPRTKYFEEY